MGKTVPCSVCGATATVHLTQIVQGQVTKVHLCEGCAEKGGAGDPAVFQLAGALSQSEVPPSLACPNCGLNDADFRKRGRLGCPACWTAFASILDPLLGKVQRGAQHLGRGPAGGVLSADQAKLRLEAARREMSEAVASEDYEAAARLRDLIRTLEGQLA
ncbi:MAG: UvrB/UvrC motif-containing protein [Opitutales bacterium]|jgi:protein arginine kinase activator